MSRPPRTGEQAPGDPFAPRPIDRPTPVPLDPGADLSCLDEAKILAAPDAVEDRPAWRSALLRWRREARERTGFDPTAYDDPDTAWVATAWNVAVVWLWDEAVRDWEDERFDPDRLLAAYAGFGGLDAVVLWHAYPVIGIDPRNQFDWYDGVPGLAELVADLHDRGVRVYLDYNPWDVGTRRAGRSDAARLGELLDRYAVDGLFLDTLKEGAPELLEAMAARAGTPALEGESRVPLARISDHQASWAQWFADSEVPGVLRARWFEPRHMMHHTRRWNRDHGAELRSAWVNGAGVLVWDVVFGVRVDWSPGQRDVARDARAVYRHLGDFVVHGEWAPLAELTEVATVAGVVGSRWRLGDRSLLTLVGTSPADVTVSLVDDDGPVRCFVLGRPGTPVRSDGTVLVPAGALVVALIGGAGADPDWAAYAGSRGWLDAALLGGDTPAPQPTVTSTADRDPGGVPPTAAARVPAGWADGAPDPAGVRVAAGDRELVVRWRQRETGLYEAAPYVEDWKPLPPRLHQVREAIRRVCLREVLVDAREVSNADYAAYLGADGPRPRNEHRLLAHWRDGAPVPGTEEEPVRYLDLDDARAYAAWRGARLPTEDEWQAAAGSCGWIDREPRVWQWTESEHRDGRTRWAILKGGAWFAATGSPWYVDGGPQDPEWSLRYLLTGGGTSRSSCVGFRCAVDVRTEP